MTAYILKRLAYSLVTLAIFLTLIFVLVRLTGNPADLYLPLNSTQEMRDAFAARLGLDQPIIVQFGRFVLDLLHLDFGTSLIRQQPAMTVALSAFPRTLQLAVVAMPVALLIAILVGSIAAYKPFSLVGRTATVGALTAASIPDFWIAIMGVLWFSVMLGWLPTSGTGGWEYWVLPVIALAARPAGILAQVVRGTMVQTLAAPYIKAARAKGIGKSALVFKHAFRNATLPVITVGGEQLAGVLSGAIVVETIFGWPGIGKTMVDSILQRDFAVVQASAVLIASSIFVLNILIDILYARLDPRIRLR
ncbi:MAG TPA: ABC transporter permease [Devosiaceae bacterium]|jgi:peptide/nickel transport system permease protein